MQRALIVAGIVMLICGLLWPWISQLPLGRLPGDLVVERPNFRLYLPLATMIVASVVISLLLWIFRQ